MQQHEQAADQEKPTAAAQKPSDIKKLWDQWDQVQKEAGPIQYVKGWNLMGLLLIIAGASLWFWGPAVLKVLGIVSITSGALIMGIKKLRALWQRRSWAK